VIDRITDVLLSEIECSHVRSCTPSESENSFVFLKRIARTLHYSGEWKKSQRVTTAAHLRSRHGRAWHRGELGLFRSPEPNGEAAPAIFGVFPNTNLSSSASSLEAFRSCQTTAATPLLKIDKKRWQAQPCRRLKFPRRWNTLRNDKNAEDTSAEGLTGRGSGQSRGPPARSAAPLLLAREHPHI
jgi:hypothetical protein